MPVDEVAFERWLRSDPRHQRAYRDIETLWADLGHVTSGEVRTPTARARRNSRWASVVRVHRRRWAPTAIAAGLALAVTGTVQDWPTRLRADAMTATGERRVIDLADGSRVQLNTSSAVAVHMDDKRRVIRLLKGEASFDVAADRYRPFIVEAAGGLTTALGTRFIVRSDANATRITVTEHRVRVAYGASDKAQQILLGEGQAVTYGPSHGLGHSQPVNGADAEAWTQGLLVFENRPLGEVVAELARYHAGYVQVVGQSVADRRVSGVFRVGDPVAAFEKLQHTLHLRSARLTDRLIVLF